jgi:hypothetical protein
MSPRPPAAGPLFCAHPSRLFGEQAGEQSADYRVIPDDVPTVVLCTKEPVVDDSYLA